MNFSNWFGLTNGKLFGEAPAYVNRDKAPGMSPIPKPTVLQWLTRAPFVLVTSPNFVWACISGILYLAAPVDLGSESAAALAPISSQFLIERLPVWIPVTLGYFGFWHITLYGMNFAYRPFIASRTYSYDKLLHNAFWTTSGIFIWTVFENIMCFLWATGRLPYISDQQSFTTLEGGLKFIAALMAVPIWRSVHFYFAHRFLHFSALYQQVHSLHHRNTDVEPFSGLCMHPVEHLYYFSCILPNLLFICSPFAFVWNGVHLLLSPAASHSGYEDHFQSDAFHYLHHRYFECNYAGTDAAFMDIFFGTFKGSFAEHPVDKDGPKPREDAKSTCMTLPSSEFCVYLAGSVACVAPWYSATLSPVSSQTALIVSSAAGFGPVILASVVSWFYGRGAHMKGVKMSLFGDLLHLVFGTLFCSIPIAYMCFLTLSPVQN
jgi:sterol desaturase/sphingolipid hydroxylase (fatty acid hydroxylase superfamily)